MDLNRLRLPAAILAGAFCLGPTLYSQNPEPPPRRDGQRPPERTAPPPEGRPNPDGPPRFGPGGPGPGGGMGQGGMGAQPDLELVKQFDKDGNKRLNAAERKAAREFLTK